MIDTPTDAQLFEFYLKAGIDDVMPFESRYGSASGKEWAANNWKNRERYLRDLES